MPDKTSLRKKIIYSVFVRNHTKEGTFQALIPDLERIRNLGTDIIWLMPIHPIGEVKRKGTLGSPYAIKDYRAVNPEFGTEEDLKELVRVIHSLGMKCIIDVVYNHTSPDSVLYKQHPEYFYKRPDGTPGNHVGEWTDIIDLDYTVPELWNYQIETLKYWAGIVDGFRCDVASFVPVDFWKKAREEVEKICPGTIWLAESVHLSFGEECRHLGLNCAKDAKLYEAFDMEYEYDIREVFERHLKGEASLSHWIDLLNFQEFAYPETYNKLRFLENHDVPRIASFLESQADLLNYTAMLYFLKGTTLIYAGQEIAAAHRTDLFDKDSIDWSLGMDLSRMMLRLSEIKKAYLDSKDAFYGTANDALDIAVLRRSDGHIDKYGIFSLSGKKGKVRVDAPDGEYADLLFGGTVLIQNKEYDCSGRPVIFLLPCAKGETVGDR